MNSIESAVSLNKPTYWKTLAQRILRNKQVVIVTTVLVLAPIWNFPLHYALAKLGAADLQWFLLWVYIPYAIEVGGKIAARGTKG
jgi:hypothetical protein